MLGGRGGKPRAPSRESKGSTSRDRVDRARPAPYAHAHVSHGQPDVELQWPGMAELTFVKSRPPALAAGLLLGPLRAFAESDPEFRPPEDVGALTGTWGPPDPPPAGPRAR